MNMLPILIILHVELSVALFREERETRNNEVDILCRAQVRTIYHIRYLLLLVFPVGADIFFWLQFLAAHIC